MRAAFAATGSIWVSVWLLLLSGVGTSAPVAARAPRAMSINLCSDQLVLALLPPERITSVSWLARDGTQSYLAAAAEHVAVNYGTAEEVARQRPDVLITGTYTTPATRALLRSVGYRVLELSPMNSFEDIRVQTRAVAEALGVAARAEDLLARMDERLTWLDLNPLPRRVNALLWDGSGAVPGPGTLYDAMVTRAGADDAANARKASMYAQFDIEALLLRAPQVIVLNDPKFTHPGRHNDVLQPAIIERVWAGRRVFLPRAAIECGTPFSAEVAVQLHQNLAALRTASRGNEAAP